MLLLIERFKLSGLFIFYDEFEQIFRQLYSTRDEY
jgi:hypothetical protein